MSKKNLRRKLLLGSLCLILGFNSACSYVNIEDNEGEFIDPKESSSETEESQETPTSKESNNGFNIFKPRFDLNKHLEALPKTYDPYIKDASDEAKLIYKETESKFDELSQKQAKRNPAVQEFLVRTLLKHPEKIAEEYAKAPTEEPFPENRLKYYSQWDQRWAFKEYAGGYFGQTGCGPTVLSMIYTTLSGDTSMTPDKMGEFSEQNGYAVPEAGTAWALMKDGAISLGLNSQELPLDKNIIMNNLNEGKYVVLIMGPGDFTSTGHFIILHDIKDGEFMVYDPFTIDNNYHSWSYEQIKDQIKNIWAISK